MARGASVRRARRQRSTPTGGFIVTWDVDSKDRAQSARVRRFVFGNTVKWNGKSYHYPGFVEQEGVRYLGQSVLFVMQVQLAALRTFLVRNGVEHVITEARIGRTLRN